DVLGQTCRAAGAALIEDAASAFGAALGGRPAGTIGDAGFYSFHRGKQITSVTGGAWATRDPDLAGAIEAEAGTLPRVTVRERVAILAKAVALAWVVRPRVYGMLHRRLERFKDTTPHEEFELHAYTAQQAGIVRSLLERMGAFIGARNERAGRAREILADADGIVLPAVPPDARPVFNHCPVLVPAGLRDRCIAAGLEIGVECTTLYSTTVYQAYGLDGGGDCPRAEELADRLLLIPCHPLVPMWKLEQVTEAVRATVGREGDA
ncbi:MAG: DegT/DnrJ/EryC1/StrS family aminotransferase, partial [Planctomycetota bacterium]